MTLLLDDQDPAERRSSDFGHTAGREAPRERYRSTIMVVEDDDTVRDAVRRVLELAGYLVLAARHGADALEQFTDYPAVIDLVLADMIMPDVGGLELCRRLRELDPSIRMLFMTGQAPEMLNHLCSARAGTWPLPKPFTHDRLTRAISDALESDFRWMVATA